TEFVMSALDEVLRNADLVNKLAIRIFRWKAGGDYPAQPRIACRQPQRNARSKRKSCHKRGKMSIAIPQFPQRCSCIVCFADAVAIFALVKIRPPEVETQHHAACFA